MVTPVDQRPSKKRASQDALDEGHSPGRDAQSHTNTYLIHGNKRKTLSVATEKTITPVPETSKASQELLDIIQKRLSEVRSRLEGRMNERKKKSEEVPNLR